MKYKISVIIPVKNAEKTIRRTVKSIERQCYSDYEVLIVNDHSTDNTAKILEIMRESNSRVRILESDGYGVSSARNIGLNNATGDIIAFCDADDYFEPVRRVFEKKPEVLLIAGDYNEIEFCDNRRKKRYRRCTPRFVNECTARMLLYYIIGKPCWELWTKFFRIEMLGNLRLNEEFGYAEDLEFLVGLLSNNPQKRCVMIHKSVYNYVSHAESATNDKDRLFDNEQRLKEDVNLARITSYTALSSAMKVLLKRARFLNLANRYINLSKGGTREYLRRNMKKTWPAFVLLYCFGLFENIKITIRLVLFEFFGVNRIKKKMGL